MCLTCMFIQNVERVTEEGQCKDCKLYPFVTKKDGTEGYYIDKKSGTSKGNFSDATNSGVKSGNTPVKSLSSFENKKASRREQKDCFSDKSPKTLLGGNAAHSTNIPVTKKRKQFPGKNYKSDSHSEQNALNKEQGVKRKYSFISWSPKTGSKKRCYYRT